MVGKNAVERWELKAAISILYPFWGIHTHSKDIIILGTSVEVNIGTLYRRTFCEKRKWYKIKAMVLEENEQGGKQSIFPECWRLAWEFHAQMSI